MTEYYCTAMILHNLALPEWISVKCNEMMVRVVFCHREDKTPNKFVAMNTTNFQNRLIGCNTKCIMIQGLCFCFHWFSISKVRKIPGVQTWNAEQSFKFALSLSSAVSAIFPPLFSSNFEHRITWTRCANKTKCETKLVDSDNSFALYSLSQSMSKLDVFGNIYRCSESQFIATLYVCDGHKDCAGKADDEEGCECNSSEKYSGKCKHTIGKSGSKTCSSFYTTTRSNECRLFTFAKTFEIHSVHHEENEEVANKIRSDNSVANSTSQHDCESKPNGKQEKCSQHGQLPCRPGCSGCFNISNICIYKLNSFGYLSPCKTGAHIQNCADFTCNMMAKCPKFYCIPWAYVCNGRWDCPSGFEESLAHGCGKDRMCTNLFKCRQYEMCLHLGDLCNGKKDCPFGDDEFFCSLQGIKCPLACDCLLYTLMCINLTISQDIHLPYMNIQLKKSCFNTNAAPAVISDAMIMSVVHSNLVHVCKFLSSLGHLIMFDASSNLIETVETRCFQTSFGVKIILLSNNLISSVKRGAFANLSTLLVLNLSTNSLSELSCSTFFGLSGVSFLSLKQNNLTSIERNVFDGMKVKLLETENYHVCCLLASNRTCTAKFPWYQSCSNLLSKSEIQTTFYVVSSVIIIFNFASIILQRISSAKGLEKIKAHMMTVTSINIADLICAVPLCILWVVDIFYTGFFMIKETQWRSSPLCYTSFGTTLDFSLLSPFLLLFLSFSRLMIVIHPIDTKFKRTTFVLKCVLAVFFICSIFVSGVTVIHRFVEMAIPSVFCSPLVDPSNSQLITKVTTWIVIGAQITCTLSIIVLYVYLIKSLKESQEIIGQAVSKKQSNASLVVQIIVVSSSNILCWIPSNVIYLISMFMREYPIDMIIWIMIAVMPINSVINPLVYIFTTVRKIKKNA